MRTVAAALAVAVGVAALLSACADPPLLVDVSVLPEIITPDQDGWEDVTRIAYGLTAPALIDIALVAADGTEHALRTARPRAPGAHEALFGGVVDGRALPDGTYIVRIAATPRRDDAAGPHVEERPLVIRGADTTPPVLAGFLVQPDTFTPNQDGIGDRVTITYRLDEPALVRVWLEAADGTYVTDILGEQQSGRATGDPGPHVLDFDAGVDADAPPPPDGEYFVVAEARDAAGNVARERRQLTIRDGGQPRAALVGDVEWSATVVPLGDTLAFTATVVNVGDTPIRTRGPEPGFVYDNNQTFNLLAPAGWLVWARAGRRTATRYVPPGQEAVDDLTVDVSTPESGPAMRSASPLAAGLTAAAAGSADTAGAAGGEPVPTSICGTVWDGSVPAAGARVIAFETDGDNGTETTADAGGRFCLHDLRPPPPSGRTFARSPGAIRLGLEYDDHGTDVAYPFRWQLGPSHALDACTSGDVVYLCLPPGARVEIGGAVRFVTPPFRRTTRAYLSLMHEDVRRMHGPYNPQLLTIEY